jgi:alkane 1-monooxygenase
MNTHVEAAPHPSAEDHRDPKRYLWLLFPAWLLFPLISILLVRTTGSSVWYWITPAYLFLAMPIVDLILGINTTNTPEPAVARIENDHYYHWITYVSVACHYAALLVGAWEVSMHSLDGISYLGMALSAGLISAYGIVTAHELGHKRSGVERWLAKITLATGVYGQYMIDHNRGHHRDVATPEDSGSARFGEGFWTFMVARQLPHSTVLRPWQLENERLARKGKGPWSLENEVLQPTLISLATYTSLIAIFGVIVIPYLLVVALTSYFFLAIIDYIEHYGLLREKLPEGRYARVRPEHSWNTDHIATNIMYMHAQRHSDHHAFPTRRYQVLRSYPDLPTMPTGYPGMFWLAILPPLWRAVMDPRLLDLVEHDLNRINVDPRRREALFRRYSRVADQSPPDETFRGVAAYTAGDRTSGAAKETSLVAKNRAMHRCPGCGYTYRESTGDPSQGFAPGTRWEVIPSTWSCPDCSVRDKIDFVEVP